MGALHAGGGGGQRWWVICYCLYSTPLSPMRRVYACRGEGGAALVGDLLLPIFPPPHPLCGVSKHGLMKQVE